MAKDMTQGNLVKALIRFSLPLVLSGLLQQLYNWADAFIVGNIEGELSLAAIGATGTVSGLAVMMITGFSLGVSILAAQIYGSGRHHELKSVLSTFVMVIGGVFLVMGLGGALLTEQVLRLLQTPADIFVIANQYLKIIFLGIPFVAVYNVYAAVLRGMGDSKAPFWAVAVSSLTNVLLDILFVAVFPYGAAGAAVATVISQALMAIFMVCYTIKKYVPMRFCIGRTAVNTGILRRGLALGLPSAIQASVSSVGNLALQNFMNGFGTPTVAAITTAYRVDSVIMLPIVNLGSGISTIVAQNTGAGNRQRAKRGVYIGIVIMTIISVMLTILVVLTGGSLIALFGVTEEATAIGKHFFYLISRFYLMFGIAIAVKGYLEGIGDVLFSGVVSIVALGIRIILSFGLASQYGNSMIAYAEGFSWVALLLMCLARFVWMLKRSEKR